MFQFNSCTCPPVSGPSSHCSSDVKQTSAAGIASVPFLASSASPFIKKNNRSSLSKKIIFSPDSSQTLTGISFRVITTNIFCPLLKKIWYYLLHSTEISCIFVLLMEEIGNREDGKIENHGSRKGRKSQVKRGAAAENGRLTIKLVINDPKKGRIKRQQYK